MSTFLIVGGQAVFVISLLFMGVFAVTSIIEGQGGAFRRSLASLVLIASLNLTLYLLPEKIGQMGFGLVLVLSAAAILFFLLSPKPRTGLEIVGRPRRIDERDVVFARFDLAEGSLAFAEYYRRRPEREKDDAAIRRIPDILSERHLRKSPLLFPLASAEFDFLEQLLERVTGVPSANSPIELGPEQNSAFVKDIVRYLGAGERDRPPQSRLHLFPCGKRAGFIRGGDHPRPPLCGRLRRGDGRGHGRRGTGRTGHC